jgi:thiol-disulfide isomerase/thioredoxin
MRIPVIALLTIITISTKAQMKISGKINGLTKADTLEIYQPFDAWYHKQNTMFLITGNDGKFFTSLPVRKPQNLFFTYRGTSWLLYAEPAKDLFITFHKNDSEKTLAFQGSLKKENDCRKALGLTFSMRVKNRWIDTLRTAPQALIALKAYQVKALGELASKREGLSTAFTQITREDLAYFPAATLWQIIWDRGVFSTRNSDTSEIKAWKKALMDVHQWQPVSDNDAVDSYFYQVMLAYYPRYLEYTASNKLSFQVLAEKVFQKPFEEINEEVRTKGKRYWEYKAIHYGLTDRALEFAIASFIDNGINGGELNVIAEAYTYFKARFPDSRYRRHIDSITATYFAKTAEGSNQQIVFDAQNRNDTSLNTILQKHKGRVVYIDLWGTWCGPCREEFAYNRQLKAYFKEKPVDFVYLAFENNKEPERLWKETSRFYALTGRHILAGSALREAIQKMYDSNGMSFPSYILVDKEGKITTLFAERPSAKDALYKQIDQLLN